MESKDQLKWLLGIATLILLLLAAYPVGAEEQGDLSAIELDITETGLGLSAGVSFYDIGEMKWLVTGERTEEDERRNYEETNYFGLQSILYPNSLSLQGMGMRLRAGAGFKGFGKSSLKESWTSENYFKESSFKTGFYLLGSLEAAVSLNLTRGIEAFAITETPEPAPIWSILNPFWFVVNIQAGPGWESESPHFKYKWQGFGGLEYRF